MTTLTTKGHADIVNDVAAAVQGFAGQPLDYTPGSVLLALAEGEAAVGLWIQGMILQVLAATRAATSSGTDLDSFVNDYGLNRHPAAVSGGDVTFYRNDTTTLALIPLGATVRTASGSQTFTVVADTSRSTYSAMAGGYLMPVGTATLAVPVQAQTAGADGNVLAGTITQIVSSIAGVSTVNNLVALTGGADAETDAALRARFPAYLASLTSATKLAIAYAVTEVQDGIEYEIIEGVDPAGTARSAYFYVVIDDGTGTPSQTLLSEVATAVDAVRATGVTFAVVGPKVLTAVVGCSVESSTVERQSLDAAAAQAAVVAYINALPLASSLSYLRLAQVAFDASSTITRVRGLTLNGGTADLESAVGQAIRTSALSVTVT